MTTAHASHDRISELLPWFANGTLAAEEHVLVERHLESCAECREELAFLEQLSGAATTLAAATPAVPSRVGDALARIEAPQRPMPSRATAERRGRLTWFRDLVHLSPPLVRWALVAQLVLILGLAAAFFARLGPEAEFVTLSGGGTGQGGARLTVMFQPNVTEPQFRQALLDAGAVLVSGPSALGVYVIELPMGDADPAQVDAAIARLRGQPAVFRFVERQP
jgi:anti-sigma factor RsiW